MSASSQDFLQDTVYQLLSHDQCLNSVWNEISSLERKGSKELTNTITEICCVPVLKQAAVTASQDVDVFNIKECVGKLLSLTRPCQGQVLIDKEKAELLNVISMVKQVMLSMRISGKQLCQQLCENGPPSVELIWRLNKHGVISLENFLKVQAGTKGFMSSLVNSLMDYAVYDTAVECLTASQEKKSGSSGVDTKKIAGSLIDMIMLRMVDGILNDSGNDSCKNLIKAYGDVTEDVDVLKKTSTHLLALVLCHRPVMKVSVAVQGQSRWTYGKINPCLVQLYKQLLMPLEACDVLDTLYRTVQQQEFNWQLILSLVSVTVLFMPEASRLLLELTDRLLQESLETCEMESAITGLLVARQACLQGPHVFMTYSDWFQRTFGDVSKSLACSRKSFVFLMKFLSDLVPYESAPHIKVHICRPPYVPAKCRQVLTDYICLAKTRLEDLKESLDQQGQEQTSRSADKIIDELESEVNEAVSLFETTGKVPTAVLEASIFRKPYYVGQFLPALLRPRHLPDKPDTKMKLIAALVKADKISQTMHSNYIKGCRKESMQLLEGVFIDSDSDDEMELSPLEQFENSLRHCGGAVMALCNGQNKPKLTVEETVSHICEAMEALLGCKPSQQGSKLQDSIDLSTSYIPSQLLLAVDKLLNFVAQTLQSVYQSTNPVFSWLQKLLLAISQYKKLAEALLRRLWSLLIKQSHSLANHHVDSLAAVLVDVQLLSNRFPAVCAEKGCTKCSQPEDSISTAVMRNVLTRNKEEMLYMLRLTSSYLKYALCAHDLEVTDAVVPDWMKHFTYLATRLVPELRHSTTSGQHGTSNIVATLYVLEPVQRLMELYQLGLQDWVSYESMVWPGQDALTDCERYEYHVWAIYQWFLPRSLQAGGCGGDYMGMATTVLKSLLTRNCGCPDGVGQCLDCQQQRHKQTNGYSRCHIINILQGITRSFTSVIRGNELPWLPQQLVENLKTMSGAMQKQRTVQDFFNFCLSLPAYLMFSNTPHCLRTQDSCISLVVDFIKAIMVKYLCEGIFLPPSIAVYITQGILQAVDREEAMAVLDYVCETCPVLTLSLIVHSVAVFPLLQGVIETTTSVIGSLFHFHRTRSLTQHLDAWSVAAAIFSHIIQGTYSEESGLLDKVYNFKNQSNKGEVYKKLAELLVLQLTFLQDFSVNKNEVQIRWIQKSLVTLLSDTDTMTHLLSASVDKPTQFCCRESLVKARYLTVLRFLKDFSLMVKLQDNLELSGLSGLLQGFVDAGNILEQTCRESDSSEVDVPNKMEWER